MVWMDDEGQPVKGAGSLKPEVVERELSVRVWDRIITAVLELQTLLALVLLCTNQK